MKATECDRAEILIARFKNCGYLTEEGIKFAGPHIRIALDMEVEAGGPYVVQQSPPIEEERPTMSDEEFVKQTYPDADYFKQAGYGFRIHANKMPISGFWGYSADAWLDAADRIRAKLSPQPLLKPAAPFSPESMMIECAECGIKKKYHFGRGIKHLFVTPQPAPPEPSKLRYQSVNVPKTDPIHKTWPYAVKDCLRNKYAVLTIGAIQAGVFAEQLNRVGFLEDCI